MSEQRDWRHATGGLVCAAKHGSAYFAAIAASVPGGCNANNVYGMTPQARSLAAHDRRVKAKFIREHGEAAWIKHLRAREQQLGLEPDSLVRRYEASKAKPHRRAA